MVRDILESRGIDAIVEDRGSFYAGSGLDRVLILDDADESRALDVVRDFRINRADEPKDTGIVWTWRCPNCREEVEPQFELCWNCGAEKPQS
jgi:hypothetical protein